VRKRETSEKEANESVTDAHRELLLVGGAIIVTLVPTSHDYLRVRKVRVHWTEVEKENKNKRDRNVLAD
jgi:hypothetical protein